MNSPPRYNAIIQIPLDWTPEQAEAATELLGQIDEAIWTLYGDDLANLARKQNLIEKISDNDADSIYDADDNIPF